MSNRIVLIGFWTLISWGPEWPLFKFATLASRLHGEKVATERRNFCRIIIRNKTHSMHIPSLPLASWGWGGTNLSIIKQELRTIEWLSWSSSISPLRWKLFFWWFKVAPRCGHQYRSQREFFPWCILGCWWVVFDFFFFFFEVSFLWSIRDGHSWRWDTGGGGLVVWGGTKSSLSQVLGWSVLAQMLRV